MRQDNFEHIIKIAEREERQDRAENHIQRNNGPKLFKFYEKHKSTNPKKA